MIQLVLLFSVYRQTVVKENYGGKVSDIIVAPQRDKDGALIRKNMQASKSLLFMKLTWIILFLNIR